MPHKRRRLSQVATYLSALLLASFYAPRVTPAQAQSPTQPPQFDPRLYQDLRWRCIGPFRGGRTVAACGVPGKQNSFISASTTAASGKAPTTAAPGIPSSTTRPPAPIGALAVAPSNPDILYVGSGEGLQRPDLSTGDGIYKSLDAGKTWKHLGLRDAQQISAIIVDPNNSDRLFVAALGHPYGPNAERGVFRSPMAAKPGPKSSTRTTIPAPSISPSIPQMRRFVYADALVRPPPAPWETGAPLEGHHGGLFKSSRRRRNLEAALTSGLPTNAQGLGRIGIGIAPSDPSRMYALVDAQSPKSAASIAPTMPAQPGSTSTTKSASGAAAAISPGCASIPKTKTSSTSPTPPPTAPPTAARASPPSKARPAATTTTPSGSIPRTRDIILLACDQGATISVNGGETWSSWYNQPTAQFYHVITDNHFPYWVYGGQQESGSAGTASRGD